MKGYGKTKSELVAELEALRKRLAEAEEAIQAQRKEQPSSGTDEQLKPAKEELPRVSESPDLSRLKQAQRELASFFELSPDLMVVAGFDGYFKQLSQSWHHTLGYSLEELYGHPWLHFVHPEDHALTVEAGNRLVSGEAVKLFVNRYRCRDGSYRWIEWHCVSLPEEELIYGVARNVTERRAFEEALQRRNKLLQGINKVLREMMLCETEAEVAKTCLAVAEEVTESHYGFIGAIDENGLFHDITLSDPAWSACRMPESEANVLVHNMEFQGVCGKVFKDGAPLVANEPSHQPGRTRVPEGHPPIKTFMGVPLKSKDRTVGIIALANKENGYDHFDVEGMGSLAMAFVEALSRKRAQDMLRKAHDELETRVEKRTTELNDVNEELRGEIEERKRIEEQLRNDEALFEALYRLMQMTEATDQEIIDFVLLEQIKITKSKIGTIDLLSRDGKSCVAPDWSVTIPQECGTLHQSLHLSEEGTRLWAQAVHEKQPILVNDYTAVCLSGIDHPEGSEELYRIMIAPVVDRGDVLAMAIVANKEEEYTLSDARQLTLLLDGMWKLLKRRQAEETRKSYMTRLEQSNRELEDFAFIASHDLQEPLRKIQTFADRLWSAPLDALGDKERDYLERMQRSAERMQELILDLLRYSRISTRAEPFITVSLKKSAEDAVTDLKVRIEETEGIVEVGELPSIEADPVQMRQLFQNLVGNGLKYHSERKPLVRLSCEPSRQAGYWEVYVQDNGIGFDERYLDRIFKPFQRLHGKEAPYKGTGMGLAICRKIVERHGGSITARSEPGKGATFIVRLPEKRHRLESVH